jgi:hypothetical protein
MPRTVARSQPLTTLEDPSEAVKRQPRGFERVLRWYSLSALKLVRQPVPPASTSSGPPPFPSWSLVRATIHLELPIVTFVVTLGRQASGRVALCQNRQGKQVEKQVG